MSDGAEIHDLLRDLSQIATRIARKTNEGEVRQLSEDLLYLLEYLRLNFDLVKK